MDKTNRQLAGIEKLRDNLLDQGGYTSYSRSGAENYSAAGKVKGCAAGSPLQSDTLAKLTKCIERS